MSTEEHDHPALGLDDVVHQKTRLALLTVLDEAGRADFPYLKRLLGLTDGNLGRHLDILAAQGLIEITKGYQGRRPRTWATITGNGEHALAAEMASLASLLTRFQTANERKRDEQQDQGADHTA